MMEQKLRTVLILGSGAIKIGEAGEFDYSGSQSIKALKQEGIRTILINPNIATNQTSEGLADQIYLLPLSVEYIERVIAKERPDGILLSFGGQTALNCGIALKKAGVFDRHKLKVLGTPIETIVLTEDRRCFAERLGQLSIDIPKSRAVTSVDEAIDAAEEIGYPVISRSAFSLGGLDSGMSENRQQLAEKSSRALAKVDQLLIEEFLFGWKEIEYEIMRDRFDTCIAICNMENIDPMGIHTGDSIVVAPSQTLSNEIYHGLREIAIRVASNLGIIGECNIQFALNPERFEYRVIEVNARLSRSSALASKATGYPIASIAAKLSIGHSLTELINSVTGYTKACFEPSLDYLAVKFPRFDLKKFRRVETKLGSEMKSVGEVMAVGRCFEEAIQKAVRMLDLGIEGFYNHDLGFEDIAQALAKPTDKRIFAIAQALREGYSVEEIENHTQINRWFIEKIRAIITTGDRLSRYELLSLPPQLLSTAKRKGFSDKDIARLIGSEHSKVRQLRERFGIRPRVKQIDTLSAEYPAQTNYLYTTYCGESDDVSFAGKNKVMILGGGPYRIGSSVEFDWCCVNTATELMKLGYRTIMVNCNPETVSTDFDICDRLYFEELTLERILDIYRQEQPLGIIVSMGGQIPNNLAVDLAHNGVRVLGTSPDEIDRAEDRDKFSRLLDQIAVEQPEWIELSSIEQARIFAEKVGYPVLIRPSYVLSGASMNVAANEQRLGEYIAQASEIGKDHPIVISKFYMGYKEIEFDAIAGEQGLLAYAISEHVEDAGVHSGDATLVFPPQRIYLETARKIKKTALKIAQALSIRGPFNIQFLAKDNKIKVIECNLRASRSFPFVSKCNKVNFIEIATKAIMGHPVDSFDRNFFDLDYVGVKVPQFSFSRLKGSDPVHTVEMSSTGEVACLGDDVGTAFLLSLLSVGFTLPKRSILVSSGPPESKAELLPSIKKLLELGFTIYATEGTAKFLAFYGVGSTLLHWPLEEKSPNVLEFLRDRKIDLVINIPKNSNENELSNGFLIRRTAVDMTIPLFTNIQLARTFINSFANYDPATMPIKSLGEFKATDRG